MESFRTDYQAFKTLLRRSIGTIKEQLKKQSDIDKENTDKETTSGATEVNSMQNDTAEN